MPDPHAPPLTFLRRLVDSATRASSLTLESKLALAVAALAALHVFLLCPPWRFVVPNTSLDSSWIQVLSYAAASHWQWGRDIVFTYGPLGFTKHPVFDDALVIPVVAWNAIEIVGVVAGAFALIRHARPAAGVVFYLVLIVVATGSEGKNGVYGVLPLMAALLYFRDPDKRYHALSGFLLVAAAVHGMAYSSAITTALASAAAMDTSRIVRRRVPVFVPLFCGAALAVFLLAGQSLEFALPFLRSIAELIAGYGAAMSMPGSALELAAFLVAGILGVVVVMQRELAGPESKSRADAWLLTAVFAAYVYLAWKSGFVREDIGHTVDAWRALAIGAGAYATARPFPDGDLRRMLVMVPVAIAAVGMFFPGFQLDGPKVQPGVWLQQALYVGPSRALQNGISLLTNPSGWRAIRRARKQEAQAKLREAFPQLRGDGPVDMIGVHQGALLAHGVDYRPLPIFQAFVAYTPWLADFNRERLRSSQAAATLFVTRSTIDNRYPLADLGGAAVDLFARYESRDLAGEYVRMTRRARPVEFRSSPATKITTSLGNWVTVPASEGIVMFSADVRPTVLGVFALAALRLPEVDVSVRLRDGSVHTHRMIIGTAREGFLLSPYLAAAKSLASLGASTESVGDPNTVVAVRIDTAFRDARDLFSDTFEVGFVRVGVGAASHDEHTGSSADSAPAASEQTSATWDAFRSSLALARSAVGTGQIVESRGTTLFAHAAATPALELSGLRSISVRYGIFPDAWNKGQQSDGVCFRIRVEGAGAPAAPILEQCLSPAERKEDREERQFAASPGIKGPVKLVFETDCRRSCSWDWSYWKDILITP